MSTGCRHAAARVSRFFSPALSPTRRERHVALTLASFVDPPPFQIFTLPRRYGTILLAFRDLDSAGIARAHTTERDRSGTIAGAPDGAGDDPLGNFNALDVGGTAGSEAKVVSGREKLSLFEEVGSSIASTTASNTAGILSVKGIACVSPRLRDFSSSLSKILES